MSDKIAIDTKIVQRFIPFQHLSHSHLADIVKGAKSQRAERGAILFKTTDSPNVAFYLLNGSVDLRDGEGKKLLTLSADSPAAQRALQNQYSQPITATAANHCVLMVIEKNLIDLVLAWDQAGEYVVSDLSKNTNNESGDWMSALLESPLFTQIPAANIQQLFTKFDSVHVKAGESIIKEGDAGDYFYVISEGTAKVIRNQGTTNEKLLAEIGAGHFFGEEALISEAPRNATIMMTSAGILKRLKKEDFSNLLHKPLLNYLTPEQVTAAQQNPSYKIVIIDVRLPIEYKSNPAPNSINIPLSDLRSKLPNLNADTIYVTACDGGRRSEIAAHILSQAGLNTYILKV